MMLRHSFIDDPWGWLDAEIADREDHPPVITDNIDGSTTRWRPLSCTIRPKGRCSHSLTPIGQSCLLLFGGGYVPDGSSEFCHLNDVWLFNGLTCKWIELEICGERPAARRGHTAQYDNQNNQILVFGGISDGAFLNDLWALDLTELCWIQMRPSIVAGECPTPRRGCLSFIYNEKFYVFGGESRDSDELEIFSWDLQQPVKDTDSRDNSKCLTWTKCSVTERIVEGCPETFIIEWFQASPMYNIAHAPSIFCTEQSTLFVFGGFFTSSIGRFIHRFRIQKDGSIHEIWDYRNPFDAVPEGRYFHGGCAVGSNFVTVGGIGQQGNNVSDSYLYHSKAKAWTQINPEGGPGPRNGLCIAPLNDKYLILFGGGEYQTKYYDDTYVLELGRDGTIDGEMHGDNSIVAHPDVTEVTNFTYPGKSVFDNKDQSVKPILQPLTPIDLLISPTSGGTTTTNSKPPPAQLVEHTFVERLSRHSEYFRVMFTGPFLEANRTQIQLSEVDLFPASICLEYMRAHKKCDVDCAVALKDKLNNMGMEEFDSVVALADMWGMHALLSLLEEALCTELQQKEDVIENALILMEYAKTRRFSKLKLKCLKRIKSMHGSIMLFNFDKEHVDPMLLQEVQDFLESLLSYNF